MTGGFNVGVIVSLGDMELAMDYLNDEEVFKPEIDIYKKQRLDEAAKREVAQAASKPVQKQNKLIYDTEEDLESSSEVDDNVPNEDLEAEEQPEVSIDWEEDIAIDDTGDDEDSDLDDEDNELDNEDTDLDNEDIADILNSSSSNKDDTEEDGSLDGLEFEEPDEDDLEGYGYEPDEPPAKSQAEIELERKLAEAERCLAEQEKIKQEREREKAKEAARKAEEARRAKAAQEAKIAKAVKPTKTAREIELERKLAEMQKKLASADAVQVKEAERAPVQKVEVKAKGAEVKAKSVASKRIEDKPKAQKKVQNTAFQPKDKSKYTDLDINALYTEVKSYMLSRGIGARTIKRVELENIFGTENIKRLTVKSYLITLRNNEVTMGR